MNYLERNKAISEEIKRGGIELRPGITLSENNNSTKFTTLGYYDSAILEGKLYLGLKENSSLPKSGYSRRDVYARRRASMEYAIITQIATKLPHRAPQLPRYYGLAINGYGKAVGIINEDLSQGNTISVEEAKIKSVDSFPDQELFRELKDIFGATLFYQITDQDVAGACFRVGGNRIVLADLNQLLPTSLQPSPEVRQKMDKILIEQAVQIRSPRR